MSAAAGPGGRTDQPLGADEFGDLWFGSKYGAMSVHGGRYKERAVNGVNRKILERDGDREGMVNGVPLEAETMASRNQLLSESNSHATLTK